MRLFRNLYFAVRSPPYRTEQIVVSKDGAVIVAWHPKPQFPYELSRPMPEEPVADSSEKLKVQYVDDMKELYKKKHERLVRRDLMRLTWTTKHRWFPNNEHRYEDARKTPVEKPYL